MTVSPALGLSGTRNWQGGAPDELAMRFFDEFRGGGKLLGLARRKDQQGIAIFALQCSKGNQRQRLFRGHHAPGNNDRRAAAALDLRFEPI